MEDEKLSHGIDLVNIKKAQDWLRKNGYEQWPDRVWHYQNMQADAEEVMAAFIEENGL